MQLWDDILYPPFRATIRGAYYGIVSDDVIDEECFHLAERAIAAFKFPKISTDYNTFYAIRLDDNTLEEVDLEDEPNAIQHGEFINELSYAEIEILIAWMKVFWCENQISNSDNFDDMYTDANIKAFSRANALDKTLKLYEAFKKQARELEMNYGRVKGHKPTMGDINE